MSGDFVKQQVALNALGIDWYVRRELVARQGAEQPAPHVAPLISVDSAPQSRVEAVPASDSPKERPQIQALVAGLDNTKPKSDVAASSPEPQDIKPQRLAEVPSAPKVHVQPFNWLVAECGRLMFVCDIKTPRLNGVWHGAAIEMLGDVAIAMNQNASMSSKYFNWPMPAVGAQTITDDDLIPFLQGFLDHEHEQPLYVLLGELAEQLALPVINAPATSVIGPSLGELFTQVDKKRELWQKLKPLR